MSGITGLSHIALMVKNIEKSAKFYKDFASMEEIHHRIDEGIHVVWLRLPDPSSLVIVMIEDKNMELSKYKTMNHFGFDADSRETVDALSKKAEECGSLVHPAMDGGHILGYFCMIKDPDGNYLEFAYGQMRTEN